MARQVAAAAQHMDIQLHTLPGRTLLHEGREWLYCSGTAYLGVHQDAGFQELIAAGLARYGGHFGGSRLSALRLDLFEEAEARLADWCGAEAALLLSSGTLAGQLAVRLLESAYRCRFAPGLHPALWGGQSVASGRFEDWVEAVLDEAQRSPGPMALFANAIDPLYARPSDFSWINRLPEEVPVILVLDDSHGIGLSGPDGGGIYAQIKYPPSVSLLVICSLGKAPGIPAGAIIGPRRVIERMKKSPLFGGASPPTPAFLHAFLHGAPIYRRNRERLLERVRQFVAGIPASAAFRYLPDFPVFFTPDNGMADFLADRGILISRFSYPTSQDEPITRIVLHALHTAEDVERVLSALDAQRG
jgi:8-amino-7-oxononanoate synthase